MRGRHTAQALSLVDAYVLQLHTCLEVELDHGQGGARPGAGCLPSESSGAKVYVQTTVELRVIARHAYAFAVIVPFIKVRALYVPLNLVTNRSPIS